MVTPPRLQPTARAVRRTVLTGMFARTPVHDRVGRRHVDVAETLLLIQTWLCDEHRKHYQIRCMRSDADFETFSIFLNRGASAMPILCRLFKSRHTLQKVYQRLTQVVGSMAKSKND